MESGDGWRTISRRKTTPITLFVSNIPDGIIGESLRRKFSQFGKIDDVYIARKKDIGGNNFAFIRFTGVYDCKAFEKSIGEIRYGHNILHYNIAKFQRKNQTTTHPISNHHHRKPPLPPPPSSHTNPPPPISHNLRNSRSYANAVSGLNQPPNPGKTIILSPSTTISCTLKNTSLVGEELDFEKLKNLHGLLEDAGIPFLKIYYYGGLSAILSFGSSSDSNGFMSNESCWQKWFKWLKPGDHTMNMKSERLAWIRIIGLPMQYRDAHNIEKISKHFGKLLEHDERLWDDSNLSNVKLCILTSSVSRINEEIQIMSGGVSFHIGVSEIFFDWEPFSLSPFSHHPPPDGPYNDESDNSMEDDDSGISETWENNDMKEDDWEEGEIPPPENTKIPAMAEPNNVVDDAPDNVPDSVVGTRGEDEPSLVNKNCLFPMQISTAVTPTSELPNPNIDPIINKPGPTESDANSMLNLSFGPINNFDPFPTAPVMPGLGLNSMVNSVGPLHPQYLSNPDRIKRRKTSNSAFRYCPYGAPPDRDTGVPNPGDSIDLNQLPHNHISHALDDDDPTSSASNSEELNTVNVGKNVGFEINIDNPILTEILSGAGITSVDQ